MAKVICTRAGAIGLHSLPRLKDGKPDVSTVQFFHVPGTAGLGRGGNAVSRGVEIPDDIWKELKAKDPVTRGYVSARDLVEVESFELPTPETTAPDAAPEWNQGIQGAEPKSGDAKGGKGK